LTARLTSLHFVSGADAVGSLIAGIAALGRQVSKTADGARLRRAIESGRAGSNGEVLWSALFLEEWGSSLPPAPVVQELRNDLSILLADDLEDVLTLMPIPGQPSGSKGAGPLERVTFVDCVLGLWALGGELVRAVELLASPTLAAPGTVEKGEPAGDPAGPLLR
jgi:hypothetical protein